MSSEAEQQASLLDVRQLRGSGLVRASAFSPRQEEVGGRLGIGAISLQLLVTFPPEADPRLQPPPLPLGLLGVYFLVKLYGGQMSR